MGPPHVGRTTRAGATTSTTATTAPALTTQGSAVRTRRTSEPLRRIPTRRYSTDSMPRRPSAPRPARRISPAVRTTATALTLRCHAAARTWPIPALRGRTVAYRGRSSQSPKPRRSPSLESTARSSSANGCDQMPPASRLPLESGWLCVRLCSTLVTCGTRSFRGCRTRSGPSVTRANTDLTTG